MEPGSGLEESKTRDCAQQDTASAASESCKLDALTHTLDALAQESDPSNQTRTVSACGIENRTVIGWNSSPGSRMAAFKLVVFRHAHPRWRASETGDSLHGEQSSEGGFSGGTEGVAMGQRAVAR